MLAVAAHQTTASAAADARIREALLRLLAGGYVDAACHLAEQLDVTFPAEPAMLAVVLGPGRQLAALARAVDSAATGRGEPVLLDADRHGRLVLLLTSGGYLHRQLPSLIHRFPGTAAGTAAMTSLGDLPRALRDADNAVRAGRRRGAALTDVADIGEASLLALVTSGDGRTFAESLLRPLSLHDESGRGDLVRTLRAWLEHNGHWDSAAAELGVHRHTVRHRIRKAAELLGRDLDSAGTRMELWAALELIRTQPAEAAETPDVADRVTAQPSDAAAIRRHSAPASALHSVCSRRNSVAACAPLHRWGSSSTGSAGSIEGNRRQACTSCTTRTSGSRRRLPGELVEELLVGLLDRVQVPGLAHQRGQLAAAVVLGEEDVRVPDAGLARGPVRPRPPGRGGC